MRGRIPSKFHPTLRKLIVAAIFQASARVEPTITSLRLVAICRSLAYCSFFTLGGGILVITEPKKT